MDFFLTETIAWVLKSSKMLLTMVKRVSGSWKCFWTPCLGVTKVLNEFSMNFGLFDGFTRFGGLPYMCTCCVYAHHVYM